MAKKASPGGAIDVEGIYKFLALGTRSGLASGLNVTQKAAGADNSVDISAGGGLAITSDLKAYFGWSDAVINKAVTAADPSNPRKSIVVAYIDLSQISAATTNNTNAFDIKIVDGTPGASPSDPSDATIQSAVSAGNPWFKLVRITLPAGAGSVVTAYLSDIAPRMVSAQPYIVGGASNTKGHLVPNLTDDTVALLNATQTFGANTTLSGSNLFGVNFNGQSWGTYISQGWIPASGTWTRVNNTTMTAPTADVLRMVPGTQIMVTQNDGSGDVEKHFYVTSASGTTVTFTGGSDFNLTTATITLPFFSNTARSYVLNFTPTNFGFGVQPTGGVYRFSARPGYCKCSVYQPNMGTSNATTFTMDAPMAAKTGAPYVFAITHCFNNGAIVSGGGQANIGDGGTVIALYTSMGDATWTASNGKSSSFSLEWQI